MISFRGNHGSLLLLLLFSLPLLALVLPAMRNGARPRQRSHPRGLQANSDCKYALFDHRWLSDSTWDHLNTTISGRLIRNTLPASVCYLLELDYNRMAYATLVPEWLTSEFHSDDPASIPQPQYANNSCNHIYANGTTPFGNTTTGSRGCHIGIYHSYVLNATEPNYAQAAVKFAREHNLRLNIKNTGHSFFRAIAYGALSIWTDHMKEFTFHPSFTPASYPTNNTLTHMTTIISASTQGVDVSARAADHNAIVVTGTSGGYGFFTGTYGCFGPSPRQRLA